MSTCFEAVDVGGRWTSTGRTLTEADLTLACMTSGDWHPIHADAEFAGTSLAGRRIFQGSYGVHLAVALAAPFPDMGDDLIGALGFSDWRYVAPLCIGDTVHVDVEIAGKLMSSKPGRGILEKKITLIKGDGSVAQQGITQMMVRCSTEAA